MDCLNKEFGKKVIRCTPENAKEIQDLVKTTPALLNLVQSLQAQNLFPGLRALQITLTGPQSTLDGGIASAKAIYASKAV